MQTVYKVITYNDLYKFLSDHKNVFDNDANFTAFYDAMFRHTHNNVNDYLYYEMQEKFFRRIIYYQNQRDTKWYISGLTKEINTECNIPNCMAVSL